MGCRCYSVVAADTFSKYGEILPEAPKIILTMAQDQAMHRRRMEEKALSLTFAERKRGQNSGLVVAIFGLAACVLTAALGATTTASVVGGATIVGLVTVFVRTQAASP